MMTELERRWKLNDHPGAIRFMAWLDQADFASFAVATALLRANPPPPDTPPGAGINRPGRRVRLPLQIRLWAELGTGAYEERRRVFAPGLERRP